MATINLGPCECCGGGGGGNTLGCAVCQFSASANGYTAIQRASILGIAPPGPQNPVSQAASEVVTETLAISYRQGGTSFFPGGPYIASNSISQPTCRMQLDHFVIFSRIRTDSTVGSYSFVWGFNWDNLNGLTVYESAATGTLDDGTPAAEAGFPSLELTVDGFIVQKCCKESGCESGEPGSPCDGVPIWDCQCCDNGLDTGECFACDNPLP